jgi:glycosyltransferase involved in cell wall biosynthesis
MEKKPKILFLARWYPNRYDPMPGLFIQRHAEAVSRFCKVGVVYTHVVENEKINGYVIDFEIVNSVLTARVYYNNTKSNIPVLSPLIKAYRFLKANRIGIRKIRKETGDFNLIHVHVLTRLGVIALGYKLAKGIPFIISEHWSRYLPLTNDFNGRFRKWITRLVVKNASAVTTVTENLANAMKAHGLVNSNYCVLANVVTDDFMNYSGRLESTNGKTTFIHVSCFEDKSKNISGLLHVIKSMTEKRNDFVFKLVGEGIDFEFLKQYAMDIGLTEETVVFTGLLEGDTLVKEMAAADLMIVFSNYENFPVVINESFVLGVPVIATRVGGIPEFVTEANGRLIPAGDQQKLEKYLTDFLDHKLTFNNQKIRSASKEIFSPEIIGKELYTLYKESR